MFSFSVEGIRETVAERGARSIQCLECVEGEGAGQGQLPAPGRGETHRHDEAPYKIHPSRNPQLDTHGMAQENLQIGLEMAILASFLLNLGYMKMQITNYRKK